MKKYLLVPLLLVILITSGCVHVMVTIPETTNGTIVENDTTWNFDNMFKEGLTPYELSPEELADIEYESNLGATLYQYNYSDNENYKSSISEVIDLAYEEMMNSEDSQFTFDADTASLYKSIMFSIESMWELEADFLRDSKVMLDFNSVLHTDLAVTDGDNIYIPVESTSTLSSFTRLSDEELYEFAEQFSNIIGTDVDSEVLYLKDYYNYLDTIVDTPIIVGDLLSYINGTINIELTDANEYVNVRQIINNTISYKTPAELQSYYNYISSDWSVAHIESLRTNGSEIVPTVTDFTEVITREDFTKLLVDMHIKLNPTTELPDIEKNPFTDTDNDLILQAYNLGLINGTSETTFSPSSSLNREQAAAILSRYYKLIYSKTTIYSQYYHDLDQISDYAIEGVNLMGTLNIMTGYDYSFNPKNELTYQEAITIIDRFLKIEVD